MLYRLLECGPDNVIMTKLILYGLDVSICTASTSKGEIVHSAYLFYNICLIHYLTGACPSETERKNTHIWYYRKDCDGRKSKKVPKRTQTALSTLETIGIYPATPDSSNPNRGWVIPRSKRMSW